MQRDVKVGIAIGVLLIALIAVFWWTKQSKRATPPTESKEPVESTLPPPVEPAMPSTGPVAPGPVTPGAPPATTGTGTVMAPGTQTTTGAPMPPPPPPPAANKTYKVQHGDTLATIAKKFYNNESKFRVIYEANKDKIGPDPNRLKDGMDLVIPDVAGAGPTTPSKTGGTTTPTTTPAPGAEQKHVVAANETLSSIAAKYYGSGSKTNIDRIYQANKAKIGSDPDNIQVGMDLVIPAAH